MYYCKFINRMGQNLPLYEKYIHLGAPVPGNQFDPKKGFKKFDKWYNRPLASWKLYWRMQQFKGMSNGNRT